MNGADIVAAYALGAKFTLVGRAYLYGLMAGGRAGVDRAIEILSGEVVRTMKLLGVHALDELTPGHVTSGSCPDGSEFGDPARPFPWTHGGHDPRSPKARRCHCRPPCSSANTWSFQLIRINVDRVFWALDS